LDTKITERQISRIWQSCRVRHAITDTGDRLDIVFPGRASNRSGCDFKDAVFVISGRNVCGDVEVHVKSSQWQRHGHYRDPKYNNIVLHVVWYQDNQQFTRLQNGMAIPTICLSSVITTSPDELIAGPPIYPKVCLSASRIRNSDIMDALLTMAGIKRFKIKSAIFRQALTEESAAQLVYSGIARALGYTQNAGPCQELARRLTAGQLKETTAVIHQQALLLGYAGLLPSQRRTPLKDTMAARLEKIWRSANITGTMSETDWCFFRVRPDNFPTRRIAALSHLMDRYRQPGLVSGLLGLVKQAPAGKEHGWLEKGLTVSVPGYWQKHFDFGISTSRSSALIGSEKASAIVLNTILPFAAAFGGLDSDFRLKRRAGKIYSCYPGRADNELTLYMKQQLGLRPDIRLSTCQQQGLIHLFNAYCRRKNCSRCPVSLSPG
jgi:hypothetical protein